MTILSVRHLTTYHYRRPVEFGVHRMMFRPRDSFDQRLIGSTLRISPEPADLHWIHDVFGNCVALARFDRAAAELSFESGILLDHTPLNSLDFRTDEEAKTYPFLYSPDELPDLAPFIRPQYPDQDRGVEQWARQFLSEQRPVATAHLLMTIACAIAESFAYLRRTAPGTQPPATTLQLRRGTCRDFALFMMEAVRSLGFAARFVSGYLYVADRDGPQYLGGGSTHAWCQVYLPGAGWVEFDPTNGIVGNRDLIRVAVARDPTQALPLSGTFFGTSSDDLGMQVEINVKTQADHAAMQSA